MKIKTIIPAFAIFCALKANSQTYFTAFVPPVQTGLLAQGSFNSSIAFNPSYYPNFSDCWFGKYDSTGNLLWQKKYYSSTGDTISVSTAKYFGNGTYLVAGRHIRYNSSLSDANNTLLLICLDEAGDTVWTKEISSGLNVQQFNPYEIFIQNNGNAFILCNLVLGTSGNLTCTTLLINITNTGNFIWAKAIPIAPNTVTTQPLAGVQDANGNIIFFANYSRELVRVDPNGNVLSRFQLTTNHFCWHLDMYKNNYVVYTEKGFSLIDTLGNEVFSKKFNTSGLCNNFYENDSGYFYVGSSAGISKFDSTGNFIWNKRLTTFASVLNKNDHVFFVDGGYLVCNVDYDLNLHCFTTAGLQVTDTNYTFSVLQVIPSFNYPLYISQGLPISYITNSYFQLQCITSAMNEINNAADFDIAPNPSTGNFIIRFKNILSGQIEILNAFGQKIYSSGINSQQQIAINLKIKAGIYFVKIANNKEMLCGWRKVVVE